MYVQPWINSKKHKNVEWGNAQSINTTMRREALAKPVNAWLIRPTSNLVFPCNGPTWPSCSVNEMQGTEKKSENEKRRKEAIEHHLVDMCLVAIFFLLFFYIAFCTFFQAQVSRCQTFLIVSLGNKNKDVLSNFLCHAKRAMYVLILWVAKWQIQVCQLATFFFCSVGEGYQKKPCLDGSIFSFSISRLLGAPEQQKDIVHRQWVDCLFKERTLDCDKSSFYLNPTLWSMDAARKQSTVPNGKESDEYHTNKQTAMSMSMMNMPFLIFHLEGE